jgi:NADH-quinone oxidoreductase subunit L
MDLRAGAAGFDGARRPGGVSGLGLGWWLYGNKSPKPEEPDVLERAVPLVWGWLRDRLYVDELYGATVIAFYGGGQRLRTGWIGAFGAARGSGWRGGFGLWAQLNRFLDTNVVDGSFDKGCEELSTGGGLLSQVQTGACRLTCGFWLWPLWRWWRS